MPLVAQVLGHGQFLVEAGGLKHDADRRADRRRLPAQVEAQDLDVALLAVGISVESRRNSVVLPPPLGPRKAKISPGAIAQAQVGKRLPRAVVIDEVRDVNAPETGSWSTCGKTGRTASGCPQPRATRPAASCYDRAAIRAASD